MRFIRFFFFLRDNTDTFVWEYWREMGPPTISQLRELWSIFKETD